jgi:hypothetical protein
MYNIVGRPLLEIVTSDSQIVIDSSFLHEGSYILAVISAQNCYIKKLIKIVN